MEYVSILVAFISVVVSIATYMKTVSHDKKQATIDAFNLLQNEVLDKFVNIDNENSKMIVDNLSSKEFKEAYDDCRALIARLEHFAVGVNKKIYDLNVVDELAGIHLIYLYKKIKPIIDYANRNESKNLHYHNYIELVDKLKRKHKW